MCRLICQLVYPHATAGIYTHPCHQCTYVHTVCLHRHTQTYIVQTHKCTYVCMYLPAMKHFLYTVYIGVLYELHSLSACLGLWSIQWPIDVEMSWCWCRNWNGRTCLPPNPCQSVVTPLLKGSESGCAFDFLVVRDPLSTTLPYVYHINQKSTLCMLTLFDHQRVVHQSIAWLCRAIDWWRQNECCCVCCSQDGRACTYVRAYVHWDYGVCAGVKLKFYTATTSQA